MSENNCNIPSMPDADVVDGNCLNVLNRSPKSEIDEGDDAALGSRRPTNQRHSVPYHEVVTPMPAKRKAITTHYKMDRKNRGVALIFNHEYFCTERKLNTRSGTRQDCEALDIRLQQLGFEVHVFKDLDYLEICQHVETFAKVDHSNNDCFLMAVLSHGDIEILYARDVPYSPENLWNPFTTHRCPSLAGKPKIFVIQACQGEKVDGGVTLSRTETDSQCMNSYSILKQPDFLIVYSTMPGYYSWRNTAQGSWFIRALCDELEENGYNYHLLTLLTRVTQRVAEDYESNVPKEPKMHRQKQIPCITSMLTRLCLFKKPRAAHTRWFKKQECQISKGVQ